MIGWFSKYRKVPSIMREPIKEIDQNISAFDKELIGEATNRKSLGKKRDRMVSGVRSKVRKNPELHRYMHGCGVTDEDDFWFMMCVYYWMFLSDGGFDVYDMEDELSYYDENGLEGYGMETIEGVVATDDHVTVEEAATINEPVLDPVERGEIEPSPEPLVVEEAATR
jgi:hypothetical protein